VRLCCHGALVSDRGGRAAVQFSIKKQDCSLKGVVCLDDPMGSLPVYAARITHDGDAEVGR